MSQITIVSEGKCKHCKFHRNTYLKRADGTETKKWIGHCFIDQNAPVPKAANRPACKKFIPYWR